MFLRRAVSVFFLMCGATSNESPDKPPTITSYDPGELLTRIFKPQNLQNSTISSRQRGYGLVFEDQQDPEKYPEEDNGKYGLITFEENNKILTFNDDSKPLRFVDEDDTNIERPFENFSSHSPENVVFQDDNKIDLDKKRKRRRRRKPKNGLQNYQGVPGAISGPGTPFGQVSSPAGSFGPNPYPNPGFTGPKPFKRRRRPRPSLASDALTAITGALTSIALYDDYQCVPRLLCEAAGGGSLGSNGVLDSIAGIQPLLTVLSAYNGISSSPLFVFGRAVFLGMTSRGNTGTCRYAYPQCPTDPEQLIHYLNNHNGGFFRFFNAPAPNQNLEQFYNHLGQNGQFAGQDDGQYLAQNGQFNGEYNSQGFQGGYGPYQPQQGNYGLYQNQQQASFGPNYISSQRPGPYGDQYGSNYDYNTYGSNNIRFKDADKIQKRIQNKPVQNDADDNFGDTNDNKLHFPDQTSSLSYDENDNISDSNSLKFPEEFQDYDNHKDFTRKGKSILFPENQYYTNNNNKKKVMYSNKQIDYNKNQYNQNYNNQKLISTNHYTHPVYQSYENQNVANVNIYKYPTTTPFNENDYYYDHKHNFYVKKDPSEVNYNNYNNQKHVTSNNIYKPVNYAHYSNYNSNTNSNINNNDVTQTVYILRGNGDPNRPEIVRVKPGQTIH